MMNEEEIVHKAVHLSMKNRKEVKASNQCGCYYCFSVFPSVNVKEWTDNNQTALCPKCSVDSILPEITNVNVLKKFIIIGSKYKLLQINICN